MGKVVTGTDRCVGCRTRVAKPASAAAAESAAAASASADGFVPTRSGRFWTCRGCKNERWSPHDKRGRTNLKPCSSCGKYRCKEKCMKDPAVTCYRCSKRTARRGSASTSAIVPPPPSGRKRLKTRKLRRRMPPRNFGRDSPVLVRLLQEIVEAQPKHQA